MKIKKKATLGHDFVVSVKKNVCIIIEIRCVKSSFKQLHTYLKQKNKF